MRIAQRKKSYCQNCQYPLVDNYNYCPNCGQENTDKRIAFSMLVQEFFSNYIGYDSSLARTIRPFLIKPGFLTNEFISGRRTKYMHPLRLYFIVSFFYFFALSLNYKQETTPHLVGNNQPSTSNQQETPPPGINLTTNPDSLVRNDADRISILGNSLSIDFLRDKSTTEAQLLDSLGWKQTIINRYIARQVIKFARSDSKSVGAYFSDYMLDKASILMFFMLPVFALLLKLVYVRQHRFYVEHLTFSLHIHAFAFLVLLLQMLIDNLHDSEWIGNIIFSMILIYGAIAARRVYRQTWTKTLLKGSLLFIAYTISLGIIATIAVIIGGLIY